MVWREKRQKETHWSMKDVQSSLAVQTFLLGIFGSCPSCLKTNLPRRLWACLEGITPASSVPQWAPLPAHFLAMWWHLWLCPFPSLAVCTSCYTMHLFSTCDSIRYLVSDFFHPLCFDNSLTSVWKGQGGVFSFRCCSPHLGAVVLAAQGISPLSTVVYPARQTSDRDIWFTQRY